MDLHQIAIISAHVFPFCTFWIHTLFASNRQSGVTPWNFWCPCTSYFHYPSALTFFLLFRSSISSSAMFSLLSPYLWGFIFVLFFLQAIETDFSNVGSMIECGLFIEALDSIRLAVYPGVLPPAAHLVSLIDYAQQVGLDLPECDNSHLLVYEPQRVLQSITGFTTFFSPVLLSTVLYFHNTSVNLSEL